MWINDNTVELMGRLNELFFKISTNISKDEDLIRLGKDNYHSIAKLRKSLEDSVREDLLDLHNLKKFKKMQAQKEQK